MEGMFANSKSSKIEEILANFFYLYPNESPALMLTSSILIGNNFRSWSKSMCITLISKNKLKFVDGLIPIPRKDDPVYGT